VRRRPAVRGTKSDLRLPDDPDDGKHPGSPRGVLSSRRGRSRLSLGRFAAVGLSKVHPRAFDDHGCSRGVELGLDLQSLVLTDSGLQFLGLGTPRPMRTLLLAREGAIRASLAARPHRQRCGKGERVLAPAGPHVRGSKSSEGVSTFRIELQKSFDEAEAQRSCSRARTRAVNGG